MPTQIAEALNFALAALREVEAHPEWLAELPLSDEVKADVATALPILDRVLVAITTPNPAGA